jgi:hypothetical protein
MNWYGLGLFLHLGCVVAAFWYAAWIFAGIERLWAAASPAQALDALDLTHRGARWMPWIGVALFLTGAWLTQSRWNWALPWISISILGLIALEGFGGASGKGRRKLRQQLHGAPLNASLPPEFIAAARGPLVRTIHLGLPLLTVGIMLVMVTKPGPLGGVIELAAAAAIGVLWGSRRKVTRPREVVRP